MTQPAYFSAVLSLTRLSLYAAFTLMLVPLQAIALGLRIGMRKSLPLFYHRQVLRILGLHVQVRGAPVQDRSVLFVSNHISYLDIEVLGSLIDGSFVAKREVAGWPGFGILAKLQQTVFVERSAANVHEQRDNIEARLSAGDSLILFPEGTSSDGIHLQPFRSGLFAAADIRVGGRPMVVQPVTIAYTRLNGIPIGREFRPFFAWYGDMGLLPHLWTMAGLGHTEVVVEFHPPLTLDMFTSRKKLAAHCERIVRETLATANSGRLKPLAAPILPDAEILGQPAPAS